MESRFVAAGLDFRETPGWIMEEAEMSVRITGRVREHFLKK